MTTNFHNNPNLTTHTLSKHHPSELPKTFRNGIFDCYLLLSKEINQHVQCFPLNFGYFLNYFLYRAVLLIKADQRSKKNGQNHQALTFHIIGKSVLACYYSTYGIICLNNIF